MFYRYIIGWLYHKGLKKKRDTPIGNVVLTMSAVHFCHLLTVYLLLLKFALVPDVFDVLNEFSVFFIFMGLAVLYYFLFFNREKWENYAQQIEEEEVSKRRRGSVLVLSYLIGSILLFFISLPILLG